jgi:anti-sigma factor RsiW
MNICAHRRKDIALLAIGELNAPNASNLRSHIAACEGCRAYFESISTLTVELGASSPDSDAFATESFHRKAVAAVKASQEGSVFNPFLRRFQLSWAWPAAASVAVIAITMFVLLSTSRTKDRPATAVAVSAVPASTAPKYPLQKSNPATFAAYEMIANDSLDKLDDVITREGIKNQAPAPAYTASSLRWLAQQ